MTDLLRLLIAPLFWLASFSLIYGLHGLACSQHFDLFGVLGLPPATVVLIATWIAATAGQVAILVFLNRVPSPSFVIQRVAILLGWTSIVAMVWTLFPVLFSPVCA